MSLGLVLVCVCLRVQVAKLWFDLLDRLLNENAATKVLPSHTYGPYPSMLSQHDYSPASPTLGGSIWLHQPLCSANAARLTDSPPASSCPPLLLITIIASKRPWSVPRRTPRRRASSCRPS